ncbi:hypothetical protein H6789_02420 [Candidatus Nomurabacteria bacterium]|nr:hypothetical protein [Candidatus Nomurabacteria bacterium]
MISYEDFAKLDIRIGTILSAEIVDGADKLLKLTVDLNESDGEGNKKYRQIISGIREFFPEPEALVGKQCPFLVNLESRVIRGLESQGMILAAGDEESFALLSPSTELLAGTKIR